MICQHQLDWSTCNQMVFNIVSHTMKKKHISSNSTSSWLNPTGLTNICPGLFPSARGWRWHLRYIPIGWCDTKCTLNPGEPMASWSDPRTPDRLRDVWCSGVVHLLLWFCVRYTVKHDPPVTNWYLWKMDPFQKNDSSQKNLVIFTNYVILPYFTGSQKCLGLIQALRHLLLGQDSPEGHIPGHCYASAGAATKGGLTTGSKGLGKNDGKTIKYQGKPENHGKHILNAWGPICCLIHYIRGMGLLVATYCMFICWGMLMKMMSIQWNGISPVPATMWASRKEGLAMAFLIHGHV